MEKNKYEILRKNIQNVELVSLTSHNWYDYDHNLVPWDEYTTPKTGDTVYNVTGSTDIGYYKWLGTTWTGITKEEAYDDFILPIYLENTINDLGVMVALDPNCDNEKGGFEQVEQLCNFTYTGNTGTTIVTFSNSGNSDLLRTLTDQKFEFVWGDGTPNYSMTGITTGITHDFISGGTYEVSIYLKSTWTTQKITKTITVPFKDPYDIENEFGIYTGRTLPIPEPGNEYQKYLTDLDYATTGTTYETSGPREYTGFTYAAFGGSKLDQKKLYGSSGYTDDVQLHIYDENLGQYYTGYTIDVFSYRDYDDGVTILTGSTKGTNDIPKEEVYRHCLTRNEHFIGFVDEPTIYSDIFVERGKQGVMEKNLRLSEIDNIGELEIYGNGYFNIRKQ